MTTTNEYIDEMIQMELEARMKLLEEVLKINGYEVTAEEDRLKIKHPNGFTSTAYFNKAKMRDAILEGGVKALTPKSKEPQKTYLKGGHDALTKARPDYVRNYYQSLEKATFAKQAKRPSRKQELEAATKNLPEKELSPEL